MNWGTHDTSALFDAAASSWTARYETRRSLIARYMVVGKMLRAELECLQHDATASIDVLDFGSGPGVFAAATSDLAARVLCVDRSAEMLQASARDTAGLARLTSTLGGTYRPDRIERSVGDELALERLPSASFTVILAIAVLEYLPQPQLTVAELLRCLTPDGTFFFTLPNPHSIFRRVEPPVNAAATWLAARIGSARLAERGCTGKLAPMRTLDISGAISSAGGVLQTKVPIPLAPAGALRHIEPNHLFKVKRQPA